MIIPDEVQCKFCSKVFCCSKCRIKHETKEHEDIKKIERECFLCNNKPFPLILTLKNEENRQIFEHILTKHLPLHCNKCDKIYTNFTDFDELSKCFNSKTGKTCVNELMDISKENKENSDTNSEDDENLQSRKRTIEKMTDANEDLLTPMDKWTSKNARNDYVSDSISSIRNISTMNYSVDNNKSAPEGTRKKLVRTTSTPMHRMLTTSSCQMSSIDDNTSTDDVSLSMQQNRTPPLESQNELMKVKMLIKSRSKVAKTPLRQVMSKSIQRAIAEHGINFKNYPFGLQRKMSFDSTIASMGDNSSGGGSNDNNTMPLDLRTSPVIRRSAIGSSDSSEDNLFKKPFTPVPVHYPQTYHHRQDLHNQSEERSKVEEENLTNQNTEIFETCLNIDKQNHSITPKVAATGLIKKMISFNTPSNSSREDNDEDDGDNDIFSTPIGLPTRSYSCSIIEDKLFRNSDSIMTEDNSKTFNENSTNCEEYENDDEVFVSNDNENVKPTEKQHEGGGTGGRLWSIVSNVMKIASKSEDSKQQEDPQHRPSLVKRAASFAGFLKKYYSANDEKSAETSIYKRRRTSSTNNPVAKYTLPHHHAVQARSPIAKRRKRIEGRKPLDRMKNISS
uniref:Putative mucin 14a n=1 Tax=Corethrella appendiculata TaxID=1370023 RepID=U5EX22_9DIPT